MSDKNSVYIRFMAPIMPNTIKSLSQCLDQAILHRSEHIHLLISSGGGSVFHGISMYNYLKGLNINITTYNFGSADSIATVLFCAGKHRICVPNARFLIHPVSLNLNAPLLLKDKDLEEQLKSIKIDTENIAKIISDTANKDIKDVEEKMHNRTTLNPIEAKKYGLATDINSNLYNNDNILYSIYEDGSIFQYIPNPDITSNMSQSPINFYNLPEQAIKKNI
ncbi:ATP-dependent Clp protease proteolytic subunit [uncultured Brachyspira sp.]|uniref:ATP-dependent Clp protease proteolytic subunit n=1 Tax=uncultured Brachyspira sp. TaxID=221953 RepID=UPI0025851335|nr:ATP-dependent Clp protease proteolytic subunit [uncultured Brachyspira sp.]